MTAISVVGLGKLGACMAACVASKGFEVIGVDVNQRAIDAINRGEAPIAEPGLPELIAANRDRLRATRDCREAVMGSDITFFVVPTPSEPHGGFSLRFVLAAAQEAARAFGPKTGYHLFVVASTVLPGSTQFGILPVLEEHSGKRCGQDFGLCYSPEFIALGSVIRDFLRPDFLLIGESDQRAGDLLAECLTAITENTPPVARMSFVNAELTKIAVNAFVTTKITFANMLGALCEALPGGDIDVVTSALGLDPRIGRRYLKGGVGYGGPCFPRDNLALAYLARQLGVSAALCEVTDTCNRSLVDRLVRKVLSVIGPNGTVAILGLAYKPCTNIIEESQGFQLAERLASAEARVIVYDPLAMENVRQVLGDRVIYAASLQEAIDQADVVVVATPDPAFTALPIRRKRTRRPTTIIDAWRLVRDQGAREPSVRYLPLGLGGQSPELEARLAHLWRKVQPRRRPAKVQI